MKIRSAYYLSPGEGGRTVGLSASDMRRRRQFGGDPVATPPPSSGNGERISPDSSDPLNQSLDDDHQPTDMHNNPTSHCCPIFAFRKVIRVLSPKNRQESYGEEQSRRLADEWTGIRISRIAVFEVWQNFQTKMIFN